MIYGRLFCLHFRCAILIVTNPVHADMLLSQFSYVIIFDLFVRHNSAPCYPMIKY